MIYNHTIKVDVILTLNVVKGKNPSTLAPPGFPPEFILSETEGLE